MNESSDFTRAARTLAAIAHALAAHEDSRARLQAALKLVDEVVRNDGCALLEVAPERNRVELVTVPRMARAQRFALRRRLVELHRMLSDDHDGAEPSLDAPVPADSDDPAPHLAVPVLGLRDVAGVLWVERREPAYDESELRLLSIVAAQLGAYLASLRLREEDLERARQLGHALRRLEDTDRKKDEFLAMLGHELRNPIGAINTALRILEDPATQEPTRYHRVIDRQIQHLSRIVDDLLDTSRVRLGKIVLQRQVVDLRAIAERWLEAFGAGAQARAHQIVLEKADRQVLVEGDPVRLEQVMSNLLTNALKYTPAGGTIRITVTTDEAGAVLRISDTGIGMTPESLAAAFDLFTQADESLARSHGGLGLGLPLVRSLVENHGGSVNLVSAGLGQGTDAVVRLPLATAGIDDDVEPVEERRPEPCSLRVLVVEDNADAREMMLLMVAQWGHRVEGVADGLTAVARALADPFDALLIDIGLPGIDGLEVARRVRRQGTREAPYLLAMTGYGQPEDRRQALAAGFDEYMVKPVRVHELEQRLAAVLPRNERPGPSSGGNTRGAALPGP